MPEFAIHNLWPITVYQSNLDVKKEWVDYAINCNYERMRSNNGDISVSKYVLNDITDLQKEIKIHIDNYTKKFLKVKNNLNFYFLNSWLVKHHPHDFAQSHCHINSLISGVFYLTVPPNSGDLKFSKTHSHTNLFNQNIAIDYESYNNINADTWLINSVEGQIILFPSFMEHSVTENLSNQVRYSLAFNLYVKGDIGKDEYRLELK